MSGAQFRPLMTVAEAKAELRKHVRDGDSCPVCTRFVKVYRRGLHATMARDLIVFYRSGREWFRLPELAPQRGDSAKIRYWGLIEEQPRERGQGHRRLWRVTGLGRQFVEGLVMVPSHAIVFDERCLRLDGDAITIRDALGRRFDYDDLMAG